MYNDIIVANTLTNPETQLMTESSPNLSPQTADGVSRLVTAMQTVWKEGMPGTRSIELSFDTRPPQMPVEITGDRHPVPHEPDTAA